MWQVPLYYCCGRRAKAALKGAGASPAASLLSGHQASQAEGVKAVMPVKSPGLAEGNNGKNPPALDENQVTVWDPDVL